MSDRDGEGPREQGLQETAQYLASGRQGHVGLHASFTVGDDLLQNAVALAHTHNTGIHVHVAEDKADQAACRQDHGKRVVERYRDTGLLDLQKSILAHCIHLDESEKELLRNSGVWIVQNVESNQNNNVGLANYAELGEHIMLGTDGMHSDMLRSARAAFLAGQAVEGIDFEGIYRRFRNAHAYIRRSGFSGDGDNNLVILDYNAPTEINADNFLGHFVYGLESGHVDSVVSGGQLVVKNKKLLTVDEDEILAFSREMGNKLWEKMKK
jgi:cytosine/adenosine deaminase-related metal-dependent hydrolase